ncbi:MAG TPA: Rrf2 family transcriptional regulator [Saprospiraceae bacterium]|nr:Rrf2 family transcriptional regulator [Saprospiraceae bacterium]
MFSKTFGYALRATAYVAIHGKNGKKVGLQEISQSLDIPHHFLGKIMQDMVRHGLLDSIKGPSGGFFANERTMDTPLVEILKITDGSLVFDQCALNIKRCNAANPCPLHHEFAQCRNGMLHSLAEKNIGQMAAEVEAGESYLAR